MNIYINLSMFLYIKQFCYIQTLISRTETEWTRIMGKHFKRFKTRNTFYIYNSCYVVIFHTFYPEISWNYTEIYSRFYTLNKCFKETSNRKKRLNSQELLYLNHQKRHNAFYYLIQWMEKISLVFLFQLIIDNHW